MDYKVQHLISLYNKGLFNDLIIEKYLSKSDLETDKKKIFLFIYLIICEIADLTSLKFSKVPISLQ